MRHEERADMERAKQRSSPTKRTIHFTARDLSQIVAHCTHGSIIGMFLLGQKNARTVIVEDFVYQLHDRDGFL